MPEVPQPCMMPVSGSQFRWHRVRKVRWLHLEEGRGPEVDDAGEHRRFFLRQAEGAVKPCRSSSISIRWDWRLKPRGTLDIQVKSKNQREIKQHTNTKPTQTRNPKLSSSHRPADIAGVETHTTWLEGWVSTSGFGFPAGIVLGNCGAHSNLWSLL